MDPRIEIFVDSDNDIVLSGLRVSKSREYVNDADVSFTLREFNLDGVGGVVDGVEDVEMTYQTGSRGQYVGVLLASVDISPGTTYILDVTVDGPDGRKRIIKEAHAVFFGTIRR